MSLGKLSLNWEVPCKRTRMMFAYELLKSPRGSPHLLWGCSALRGGWECLWINCHEDRETLQLWWNLMGRFALVNAQCKNAKISRDNDQGHDRRVWDRRFKNYEGIRDFFAILPCNGNIFGGITVDLYNLSMIQELFCPHPREDLDLIVIHSKSKKVCGVCYLVTKKLRKKCVNLDIQISQQKCVNH